MRLGSGPPGHPVTQERQIAQHLREIFWLVPVALARKLHDCGHYAAALDWYQTVFAYQLPAGPALRLPRPGARAATRVDIRPHPVMAAFVDELNPHFTARDRNGAYTRFTVMSIVECFLAFADSEFARSAPDSNARARALYQTAADLLELPEVVPERADVPFPVNPVWRALQSAGRIGLSKIHAGLNIAGQADLAAPAPTTCCPACTATASSSSGRRRSSRSPSRSRSAYLSALERLDAENYDQLHADHDLRIAQGTLAAQTLRVDAAANGVGQAELQRDRAQMQFGTYDDWIDDGLNSGRRTRSSARAAVDSNRRPSRAQVRREPEAGKSAFTFGLLGDPGGALGQMLSALAGAASTCGQYAQTTAGFERRKQEWQLNRNLADKDVQIANSQIAAAQIQHSIADAEQQVAIEQLNHAAAVAEFLATKFTNAELYEWMSGVLARVYAFFLQQATAVARLAQAQLAFERQEPLDGYIAADYWQPARRRSAPPSRPPTGAASPARPGCCRTSTASTSTPSTPTAASCT